MDVRAGCKLTEVGVVPEEWDDCQLSEISKKITDGEHLTPIREKAGYFLLSARNVLDGRIDVSDVDYVGPVEFARIRKRCNPEHGDILISCSGTIGRVAVVPPNFKCVLVRSAALIKLGTEKSDNFFIQFWLQGKNAQTQISNSVNQGAQPNLFLNHIERLKCPLPPLPEQRAIATALLDVDALLDGLDQLITKKRDIKQAAMQQLLTGKQRLPGFSGEWRTRPMGEVIVSCSSGATPFRGRPEYYKGAVKWITSGELNYNVITDTIEHISAEAVRTTNLRIHPVGTFLMAITGLEAPGTRGACGIVGNRATTNQSCMAIYPTSELLTPYLYHYYVFRGKSLALQYCQGTKQQSYTAKLIKLLPIEVPPTIEEQAAVVAVLSAMDAEISALEQRRGKTRTLKQGMMQELLTGRIRLS